jgi:hypothetical protein
VKKILILSQNSKFSEMRNSIKYITTLFLISILIYSCAVFDVSYSKKPEKVAEKFLNYFYKCEYEKAKKYGTTQTRQIIDLMDQLIAVSGQNTFPKDSKVVMLDTEIKGDTARCNYFVNDVKNEIILLKTDGKWLVDLKKETQNKSGKSNFFNERNKQNDQNNNKK